jgi:hypothetical protein
MDEKTAVAPPHDASEHVARKAQFRSTTLEPVIVLTRPDDETLNIAVEYGGDAGEDITTATNDLHGSSGMGLVEDTVKSLGEALGIRVVER